MKVKELIEVLKKLPQDQLVVIKEEDGESRSVSRVFTDSIHVNRGGCCFHEIAWENDENYKDATHAVLID